MSVVEMLSSSPRYLWWWRPKHKWAETSTVKLWKNVYLACALQKKQHKLRTLKLVSPPDRTGASGRKKQKCTEENLVRFDGPETTRLLSISETAQKIRLRLKIQFVFEVERDLTCPEPEDWWRTGWEILQGWRLASDLWEETFPHLKKMKMRTFSGERQTIFS